MKALPGVNDLPIRRELPDVMTMNDGKKVTTRVQWEKRREEMKRILVWYVVGQSPPPPGNVKGKEVKAETVLDGAVHYRLVHLTFGPSEKLGLDIGIFTSADGGPFPAIILQGGTPPGGTALPRLPQGPNQGRGEDVLLLVGRGPTAIPAVSDTAGASASTRPELRLKGVTTLCAPPTAWRMLIQEKRTDYPVAVRELVGAGEPLNPEVIEQGRAR